MVFSLAAMSHVVLALPVRPPDLATAAATTWAPIIASYCSGSICDRVKDVGQTAYFSMSGQDDSLANPEHFLTKPQGFMNAQLRCITIGGDRVGGDLISWDNLKSDMDANSYNCVAFDFEGDIATPDKAYDGALELAKAVKNDPGDYKVAFVTLGAQYKPPYTGGSSNEEWARDHADAFDYIALMLYGATETEQGYGISCNGAEPPTSGATIGYLDKWAKEEFKSKIIIGMTPAEGKLETCMAEGLYRYASAKGMSGTFVLQPAQEGGAFGEDQVTAQVSIKNGGKPGPAPSPAPSPSPGPSPGQCTVNQCVGGPNDGLCCGPNDTNKLSGGQTCSNFGLENCCGGSSATSYCQKL